MIILASSSPRRIEMLMNAGYDPVVKPASVIEELPFQMSPATATMYLALSKADAVYKRIVSTHSTPGEWPPENETLKIIGADTVVVSNGNIIGKPSDEKEAYEILSNLRGKSHHVITGCCVLTCNSTDTSFSVRKQCFFEDTKVFFTRYSLNELKEYVKTDEPYDKAGGYAIQGTFGKYVDHIQGDMNNVIGLPLYRLKDYL